METFLQDLRYGLRIMLKSPGFAAVAVLSLALGIGANTAIFSLINATLLKPLPYQNPEQLMLVYRVESKGKDFVSYWSYPKFQVLRDSSSLFEQVAAFSNQNLPLTGTDDPERLQVEMVSASYFPLLGIEAVKGRTFSPEEDLTPNTHAVALIGYGLWQRRYGSDPNVLGQTISLNKVPFTVVGIMPEGFRGQSGTAEAWLPMMMAPAVTFPRRLASAHAHWHQVIARLKPGVTLPQAEAEMQSVAARIDETLPAPGDTTPEALKLVGLKESRVDPAIRRSFLILFAAVAFVLLIACMNTANLLLARAVARKKEIAIRLALGAGRARLIRQLLTESVILSLAGGLVGLLVTLWGIEFLGAFKPATAPPNSYINALDFSAATVDAQVLIFNLLLSLVTGVVFGLIPALYASRPDVNDALKESATSAVEPFARVRRLSTRNILVVGETALALVLLVGAGLMIRSFANLQAVPVGFDPDDLLTLKVQLPKYSREAATNFYEELLGKLSTLPGIESATVASSTPLSKNSSMALMTVEGRPQDERAAVGLHSVGTEHFRTLRIPLRKGRAFTNQDRAGAKLVAIINETAAERFFPDQDPIGKRIHLSVGWEPDQYAEIVGVVSDVKYSTVEEAAGPDVYLPYLQPSEDSSFVIVRATGDPSALAPALRREITLIDKNVPAFDIKTMSERTAEATSKTRFSALLLAIFAALAMTLAAIGIYGVMAYAVSGRTREIGIRMALGAQAVDVMRMVIAEGALLTVAGLGIGLAGALATTRVLGSQLYGVGATDPATFGAVSALLAVVALIASYIPARRATKIDPMIALRYE